MIYPANMEINQFVDIAKLTTFRMGPKARYFCVVKFVDDLKEAYKFATERNLAVFVLGSGSNIIMSQPDVFEALVLKIELPGFEVIDDQDDAVMIKIGAGENWDSVVKRSVDMNLWGIEALSAIPGTVGATPIQNVGAYGTEIADTLVSLEIFDPSSGEVQTVTKEQCQFSYRDSVFKREWKGKYVITSLSLKLSKIPGQVPSYPGVKKYFEDKEIAEPNLQQIRQAIIDIRNVKLPDPKEVASVGSFFKNPFVSADHYEQLKQNYPNIVAFPIEGGGYKIGAGWMLETLGLKGQQFGNLQFYPNNALVMVNKGDTTFGELEVLVNETKAKVKETFGIDIEMEPIVV